MNSKGDTASPCSIPLWIFASAKLLPPVVNSSLQVFMFFSIKFMTSSDVLHILRLFIMQLCRANSHAFLFLIQAIAKFFRQVFLSFRMC